MGQDCRRIFVLLDLKQCRRVVVKVGSSTLTYETGRLNLRRVEKLVRAMSDLKNFGRDVVLVTSGAVSTGAARLGLSQRPRDVRMRQAAAAVGQLELLSVYSRLFGEYGHTVAQLLLTRDVMDVPELKENVRNTFDALLEMGTIPIVNENDTISTFELEHLMTFGDNDTLASICAQVIDADLLILLSDIDGLYDADPRSCEDARRIPVVRRIDEAMEKAAGGEGSNRGTGGMSTKLSAARRCMEAGIPMVIASGEDPDIICDILDGRRAGTVFLPGEGAQA